MGLNQGEPDGLLEAWHASRLATAEREGACREPVELRETTAIPRLGPRLHARVSTEADAAFARPGAVDFKVQGP